MSVASMTPGTVFATSRSIDTLGKQTVKETKPVANTKTEAQEADSSLKELDLPTLVGGIVQDTSTLLGQQVQLLRAELTQEARRAGGAVAAAAAGGGLLAAGGLLSG